MNWIVLLFALAVVSIFLEVIVPGGVLGTVGIIFLLIAVILAFTLEEDYPNAGWISVATALVIGPASFLLGMKLIPNSPLGKALRHRKELNAEDGYVASDVSLEGLVGKSGEALTQLRPSGTALIEDRRVDVVTRGFMVASGARIRVVEVEGNRVVVEEEATQA